MWPSYQPCTAACKIAVSGVASPEFMALIAFSTISLSTEACGSGNGGEGIGPWGPVMSGNPTGRSATVPGFAGWLIFPPYRYRSPPRRSPPPYARELLTHDEPAVPLARSDSADARRAPGGGGFNARDFGVRVAVVGNKIDDAGDVAFLREQVGDDLLAWVGRSSFVKAGERGQVLPITELEPDNTAALAAMRTAVDACPKDWQRYTSQAVEFHLRNAAAWASALPYAWAVISEVAADLRRVGGDFADHAVPPPGEAERGQLLRALASDAIRGGLERHFGVKLAFQNCHRVAAFTPSAVDGDTYHAFVSSRGQILNQSPELRDC